MTPLVTLGLVIELLMVVGFTAWHINLLSKLAEPDSTAKERFAIKKRLKESLGGIIALVSLLGFFVLLSWFDKHGPALIDSVVKLVGSRLVQFLVALSVGAIGGSAYLAKRWRQFEYGVVEVVFGLVASLIAVYRVDHDHFFNTITTLAGCIYIVVRGISNVVEGGPKRDERLEKARANENLLQWGLSRH